LIDVFRGDKTFAAMSSMALQSKLDDVLTVAPITYVELSPEFNGDADAQDAFLDAMWIHRDFNGSKEAVLLAHKAWHEHIMRKRAGRARKRPIADVLIGAYALQKGGLITRNEADFRTLYPTLTIFNPMSVIP
jgi:predicted nucleic acid-binding protein